MRKFSKTVCLLLAAALLCVSLAGCTSSASDDIVKTIAGIPGDTVFLTIDGREITAEEYLYWACLVLDTYYYGNVGGTAADDATCSWVGDNWEKGLSTTVLGYLANYNAPMVHGEETGCAIDEEELAELVDTLVANAQASYGSQETFELYLSQICISPDGFRHIMEENAYYQYLLKHLYYNDGEYAPTDEEILTFADDNGYYACRYVFFSTIDCYTDEAIARVRDKAQLFLDNLDVVADPDDYFAAAITDSNWNDDREESADGLTSVGGTISTGFDEAVRSLEVGETSGIVDNTDEYGYFVIQRLAIDPDDVRDACCAYLFSQLVGEWVADAEVEPTDAFTSFNFQNFYVSLTNYRLSTEADAANTGDTDAGADAETTEPAENS